MPKICFVMAGHLSKLPKTFISHMPHYDDISTNDGARGGEKKCARFCGAGELSLGVPTASSSSVDAVLESGSLKPLKQLSTASLGEATKGMHVFVRIFDLSLTQLGS